MLIKTKKASEISENFVTSQDVYNDRRKLLKAMGVLGIGSVFGVDMLGALEAKKFIAGKNTYSYTTDVDYVLNPLSPYEKVTTYNNFYEFGMQKDDPYHRANVLQTSPWSIVIDGEVQNPIKIAFEDILKKMQIQERIYHFRCVEAWSMNIPWLGFELRDLLKIAKPKGNAKFVLFESAKQDAMPAVKNPSLAGYIQFPYKEGLRLDEANHRLTMLAVGLYGKILPNQNGAPIRLIVPWKYGFKSIKSIVKITLVENMPRSTWMGLDDSEYGFYANVNPNVNHPRWSQASERFIGDGFSFERMPTKIFNGYQEEVAQLYTGMDLKKNY